LTDQRLLTLSVKPSMEEELVDWFLCHDYLGFSTWPAYSVGVSPDSMSLSEQVAGQQRRIIFKIHGVETYLNQCMENLAKSYPNADIYFWLHPLIRTGCLKTWNSGDEMGGVQQK